MGNNVEATSDVRRPQRTMCRLKKSLRALLYCSVN